jgi:hypothetical protein
MSYKKCSYIFIQGSKKGQVCNASCIADHCKQHKKFLNKENIRIKNSCKYVFKQGLKKDQICNNTCIGEYCKFHKKETVNKKKEYYENTKESCELTKVKNQLKNGKRPDINKYINKKNDLVTKNLIGHKKILGIQIFRKKITEEAAFNKYGPKFINKHYNYLLSILKEDIHYKEMDEETKNKKLYEIFLTSEQKKYFTNLSPLFITYNSDENKANNKYEKLQGKCRTLINKIKILNNIINEIEKYNLKEM